MAPSSDSPQSLVQTDLSTIRTALSDAGLWLDFGAAILRLQSDSPALAAQVQSVYRHFPLVTHAPWADIHVRIGRQGGIRRWLRPQVTFSCDGSRPFDPFPASAPLPLLEWGTNWVFGRRMNDLLLFHAGAVERDGLTLLLPALPGSGKSTLTAALASSGWRLLSDEFGAWDPLRQEFRAVLKPVALKNESIAVIRRFAPQAHLGPEFPNTRKGTVVHLSADAVSVARRHQPASPGAVVLPQWSEGSATVLQPLSPDRVFALLAFNSFNYSVLAEVGFDAVVQLVRRCPAWQLTYSRLDEAVAALNDLWTDGRVRRRSGPADAEAEADSIDRHTHDGA